MRNNNYILDENRQPIAEPDLLKWAHWMSKNDNMRRVDKTTFLDTEISTVFLGMNFNFGDGLPILYETMVFGGLWDMQMWRYPTEEEAQKGHDNIKGIILMYYQTLGGGKWRRAKKHIENGSKYNKQGRAFYSRSMGK